MPSNSAKPDRYPRKALTIPDDLWSEVQAVAASQDMSAAQFVRLAIRKLLKEIPKAE